MEHLSEAELQTMLKNATEMITVGAVYQHYKEQSHRYRVKQLVIWVGSNEVAVIYEALYGERITFARALIEWLETVEWNGKTIPRFTKLGSI